MPAMNNPNTAKNTDPSNTDRTIYAEGFTYEPVPIEILNRITGKSYPKGCPLNISELNYVRVKYYDFHNQVQDGELIVNASIAQDTVEIFKELFDAGYQIEKIRLIDEYNADDDASMADNNTSAFNYRYVDGTTTLSDHSYGMAIDINPLYNPYVRSGFGDRDILPVNGAPYSDRNADFPHKITRNDICYNAFIEHGFKWGGEWDDPIDYQHFYKE